MFNEIIGIKGEMRNRRSGSEQVYHHGQYHVSRWVIYWLMRVVHGPGCRLSNTRGTSKHFVGLYLGSGVVRNVSNNRVNSYTLGFLHPHFPKLALSGSF